MQRVWGFYFTKNTLSTVIIFVVCRIGPSAIDYVKLLRIGKRDQANRTSELRSYLGIEAPCWKLLLSKCASSNRFSAECSGVQV